MCCRYVNVLWILWAVGIKRREFEEDTCEMAFVQIMIARGMMPCSTGGGGTSSDFFFVF